MRRFRTTAFAVAALALLAAPACSDKSLATDANVTTPKVPFAVNFDRSIFDKNSANITNEWFPSKPGTQWLWEGHALDGDELIRRRLVSTVTEFTKEIAGVQTVVAWDRDYNNELLVESELIFLAQDKEGNVWHLGETLERYDEEGQLEGIESWLVGYLDGAKAGILMPAKPKAGTPAYSEGYAPPPYYWNDFGKVTQIGQKTCVPSGCYDDVMVIEESEPAKEDAFQTKFFARGVGNIKTGWGGAAELEQEVLELVRMRDLGPADRALVRTEVLNLEARAYVYGYTKPLRARTTTVLPSTGTP